MSTLHVWLQIVATGLSILVNVLDIHRKWNAKQDKEQSTEETGD